jgi:hypothetical protein
MPAEWGCWRSQQWESMHRRAIAPLKRKRLWSSTRPKDPRKYCWRRLTKGPRSGQVYHNFTNGGLLQLPS